MKRFSLLIVLLVLTVAATGCLNRPANFTISGVKFDWSHGLGKMTGQIANTGGSTARYVELGVKLTPSGDDPSTLLATGWTNFANFSPGEKRNFTIFLSDIPAGEFHYWFRWSLDVGGAMY